MLLIRIRGRSQGIKCKSEKGTRKLFPYGSVEPLSTLGKFGTSVQLNNHAVETEFVVISGKGRPLLSRETAVQLGVSEKEIRPIEEKVVYTRPGDNCTSLEEADTKR